LEELLKLEVPIAENVYTCLCGQIHVLHSYHVY